MMEEGLNGLAVPTKIMSFDDIEKLVKELSPEDKEKLAQAMFAELPAEVKMRAMASELGTSGLVVVMGGGSNWSINTEISIQIQNAQDLNFKEVIEALIAKHKDTKNRVG